MAEAKTSGFRWLPSYYEAVWDLPDGDRLALYDAILDFGFGNPVSDLPSTLAGFFRLIVPTLEKSVRFEAKQRENGLKGGRPRNNPPKTLREPNRTQEKPKITQNDFGENLAIAVAVESAVESAVEEEGDAAKPPRAPRFVRPTVEEVRSFCVEKGYHVDAEKFFAYYESNGWRVGKNPMRSWQSAVMSWERRAQDGRDDADYRSGFGKGSGGNQAGSRYHITYAVNGKTEGNLAE